MKFDLELFLKTALGGLDVPGIEEKAAAWIAEKAADYPDLGEQADALRQFLHATIAEAAPALDPTAMRETLLGVARDIVRGQAGVDKGAWMGG